MPRNRYDDHSEILEAIDLLKFYFDIGIYDDVTSNIKKIDGFDNYELELIGLECVAPISTGYTAPEFHLVYKNIEIDDFYEDNYIQLFSSPEMLEYYRLCRLYEYREGVVPEDNPYVVAADRYYRDVLRCTQSYFGAGFDDDHYTQMLLIETSPESEYEIKEIIELIHDMLTYYTEQLPKLDRDLKLGKLTFLPELPAHTGGVYV